MAEFSVGVAGIVRDEAPYLLEWFSWYQMQGVEHFVMADHGSGDGTTELLQALERLGIVTRIPIDREARAPQLPAYARILSEHAHRFEWLGFLDADEFVVTEPGLSLVDLLREQPSDVGGVALNWALYGSSHQPVPDRSRNPSPVTERFTWRGEETFPDNRHVKCFVRPGAKVSSAGASVHAFVLPEGQRYTAPDGTPDVVASDGTQALTVVPHWERARLNHYSVKSYWEFVHRKQARGRADIAGPNDRDVLFYKALDVNDVFDPMRPELVLQLRDRMEHLAGLLASEGYVPRAEEPVEPLEEPAGSAQVHFRVESGRVCFRTGRRYVEGWCFDDSGQLPLMTAGLTFGHPRKKVAPEVIASFPRPDVQKDHAQAPLMSGFRIYLPSSPIDVDDDYPVYDGDQQVETVPGSMFTTVPYLAFPQDLEDYVPPAEEGAETRGNRSWWRGRS